MALLAGRTGATPEGLSAKVLQRPAIQSVCGASVAHRGADRCIRADCTLNDCPGILNRLTVCSEPAGRAFACGWTPLRYRRFVLGLWSLIMMMKRPGGRPSHAMRIAAGLAALALGGCGALMSPHAYVARAQREMKAGQWHAAAFDLRAALHKAPNDAQAWTLLARLSLRAGDVTGAQSALSHATAAGAHGMAIDELQARTWLAGGQAHELLQALARHTLKIPQPERTLLTARAWLESAHPRRALALVQPLLAREPKLAEARDLVARAQIAQGKFPEALATIATAIRNDPHSPAPRLIEGRIEAAFGQFPAAEQALRAALARMPPTEPLTRRVEALVTLSESRLALGEIKAAGASVAALTHVAPQAPMTGLLQARMKLVHGDFQGATDQLERLVQAAPRFVPARTLLGATLLQRGQLEQAQQQLQEAVALAPGSVEARKLLAQVQLKLGLPREAVDVLAPALDVPQLNSQLLPVLGAAVQNSADSQRLIAALEHTAQRHPNAPQLWVSLAQLELGAGEPGRALAALGRAPNTADLLRDRLLIGAQLEAHGQGAAAAVVAQLLSAQPRDAGVLVLGASYFAAQHQLARARSLLHQALAIEPDNWAAWVALARVEDSSGDTATAQRQLQAALAAHPQILQLRLALADALARARQFDQARALLAGAAQAARQPAVQFALARLALLQGNVAQANQSLAHAIAARPGSAATVEQAGLLLFADHQNEAALARFAQAAQLEPGNPLYWLNTARAQLAVNQPLAAEASLEKAVRLQPNWLPAEDLLVGIDLRQGKAQAALMRVKALLRQDPNDPQALTLEGDVELAANQPAAALGAYAAAQRIRPSALGAVKLYQAERAAHRPDPALPLKQWLARSPGDWAVRTVLGDYELLVARQPRRAVRDLRAAIAQNPADVVALNNLAWAMGRAGDPRAARFAERAYKLAPQSPAVNDTLGWILVRQGHSAAALRYLARATRLDPGDPQLQYHYAYGLAKTGQSAQARGILQHLLADPRPFKARAAAKRLLATLKT
jgi:putative PEP-CTERM system TPR-repeat lipoprotein